jgi:DNA-binding transcriptional regulator YdaS (Cro superfamily)
MDELREYLKSLGPAEQAEYAERCGTTIGYLRKALCTEPKLGESLAIALDRESNGAVPCEKLRPDVDWAYLRRVVFAAPTGTPSTNAKRTRAGSAR